MPERVNFISDGLKLAGLLHIPDDLKPGERRPAFLTGAAGNWLGERALERMSERRFRLLLQTVLSVLAVNLLVHAFRGAGWL